MCIIRKVELENIRKTFEKHSKNIFKKLLDFNIK
nr:hypothetical protein [Bacillus subtilis]